MTTFTENKHTCQLSTIEIDEREKIQEFFIVAPPMFTQLTEMKTNFLQRFVMENVNFLFSIWKY